MFINMAHRLTFRPMAWGLGAWFVCFMAGVALYRFWMPLWLGGLDLSHVEDGQFVEYLNERQAWSPPVIAFRVFQFGGWFIAGMVTALKAGSDRIAHALGAAVLGTLVFMNPLHSLLCMLLSALGAGAVAVREGGRAG